MDAVSLLKSFSFSQYESSCYLTLLTHHPVNGSRLSTLSGIARSRIYDVLRGLIKKGLVFEVDKGQYVPLPFEELKKRLKNEFDENLSLLEDQVSDISAEAGTEYLLTLKGYDMVMDKAADIIDSTRFELYLRLFPKSWERLKKHIKKADKRGAGIRLVAMGEEIKDACDIQVLHPFSERLEKVVGGEAIDIISDKEEALVGIFETGLEDVSPVIWTRNRSFVTTNRDSLRHDFYHYFLHKLADEKKQLTEHELKIYEFIKNDDG